MNKGLLLLILLSLVVISSLSHFAISQYTTLPIPALGQIQAIAVSTDGNTVYVGTSGSSSIYYFNTQTDLTGGPIIPPYGASGYWTSFITYGNTLYASDFGNANVFNISTSTNLFVSATALSGSGTFGPISQTDSGDRLFIGEVNLGNLEVVSTGLEQIANTIQLPTGSAISTAFNGNVYASDWGASNVYDISLTTNSIVNTIPIPNGDEIGPLYLYNTNLFGISDNSGNVYAINTITDSIDNTIALPDSGSYAGALCQNGGPLYISDTNSGNVYVVNTITDNLQSTLMFPTNGTFGIALSQDGNTLYVGDNQAGNVYVINSIPLCNYYSPPPTTTSTTSTSTTSSTTISSITSTSISTTIPSNYSVINDDPFSVFIWLLIAFFFLVLYIASDKYGSKDKQGFILKEVWLIIGLAIILIALYSYYIITIIHIPTFYANGTINTINTTLVYTRVSVFDPISFVIGIVLVVLGFIFLWKVLSDVWAMIKGAN